MPKVVRVNVVAKRVGEYKARVSPQRAGFDAFFQLVESVTQLFQRHLKASRIQQALNLLQTAGKVHCERRETNGRSVEVWTAI